MVKKQKIFQFFRQASNYHQIPGLELKEQKQFLKTVWQEQGSIMDVIVKPTPGLLDHINESEENILKSIVISFKENEFNQFFR